MAVRDVARPDSGRSATSSPVGDHEARSSRGEPRTDGRLGDKYRTLFTIGRGGMGAVEAALAGTGDAQRVVALKRLLPDAARDRRRIEMFLREAKLAALLDHPNVVRAIDSGEIDGELYLAMEYVEGQPLSRLLKELEAEGAPPLDPALAAYVMAEVCEGLHAAHELEGDDEKPLRLVHRDVSPQNVMIGYDGSVRLLDFGVAKIEAESQTKTGEVKGKAAYMSPEQAMGDALDRRSDLFGVGAVLFECLALHRMWGDGTDMEVIRKLALEEPPALEGEAPAALRGLYTRLVARKAGDRPADARSVAEELRAFSPQGREWAARAMSAILERHFGDDAKEQRAQLAASLEEVAPSRARALRESTAPERPSVTPPPRSVRLVAATTAEASHDEARAGGGGIKLLFIAIALALVGYGGYRVIAREPESKTEAAAKANADAKAKANAEANAKAEAEAEAAAKANAEAEAKAKAEASAKPEASARPEATAKPEATETPPAGSAKPKRKPKPPPTAATAPTAATKPLDVDPNAIP